jgi:solute carrier family 35 (UDP-sugar transporter), member A1/2/3
MSSIVTSSSLPLYHQCESLPAQSMQTRAVHVDADMKDKGEKKSTSGIAASIAAGVASESSLPAWQSISLALIYMFGCITFYLLIRYSKSLQKQGQLVYDSSAAVFFTELFKWLFSVGAMYYRTGKFLPVSVFREGTWRVGIYFAVPSGIYAVYNNLTYFNLSAFDPGTYQVFMQTRVLFTGVLYTWILSKTLTQRKWMALVLLTFGVAAKYFTFNMQIDYRVVFMLFQASLSAFAGVYNEFLLKRDISMDVNEQNFFMYSFALLFNLGWGLMTNTEHYTSGEVFSSMNGIVLIIVLNGATIGIVTSLILKFINVIVKAFASACEVLLTAVLAALFLGEVLTLQDVLACSIVMVSIYFYYALPTVEKDKPESKA